MLTSLEPPRAYLSLPPEHMSLREPPLTATLRWLTLSLEPSPVTLTR